MKRLLIVILVICCTTAAVAADRPRIELPRLSEPPAIDGKLDDAAWQGRDIKMSEWLTYNPLNGSRIPQTTVVYAGHDDRYLYFAFHCIDPEPGRVRATLSRRDSLFNDDWVGLSLDSAGNGQASYDLFVNPLGVQGDILNSVASGENTAPDFVWDSAGRRTEQGYDVELRIPLTTIRFTSGSEVHMGVLFWRRVSRLGISVSWPAVPAGASFFQQHAQMSVRELKRPLTLEVIPTTTFSRSQARVARDRFGRAESDPSLGGSVKYGITSSATVEATLNPDFSQVESDAYQVDVNQRFPLFFSEKRPFFMESLSTFEMAGVGGDMVMRTAVHTRRIADPAWGGKSSGSAGRLSFAVLAAGDDAPGRVIDEGPNLFAGDRKEFFIGRAQYGLGPASYIGAIGTDTEFGRGYNRVAGVDGVLKRGAHLASATAYVTTTRSADGITNKDGLGGQVYYEYATKPWVFFTQTERFDPGFEMDTAFLNQVGVTINQTYLARRFYPDEKKTPWLKRIETFLYFRGGRDEIQRGNPWFGLGGIRINLLRQGFFRADYYRGQEPWLGHTFRVTSARLITEAQLTNWLYFQTNTRWGKAIFYDEVASFGGNQRAYNAELRLDPMPRLSQTIAYDRVEFDRESGERVFTVNVLNTKTQFQLDRRFSVRGIVNYNSAARRILTDFLASWELTPGTVVYAGYGSLIERQQWDGTERLLGVGPYLTSRRGLFFKASYIHRF